MHQTHLFAVAHEYANALFKGMLEGRVTETEDVYGYQNGERRAERNDDAVWVAV